MRVRRSFMVTAGPAAAGLVVSALVLAGCADDSGNDAAPPTSTATTVVQAAPEDVARDFLDVYGAYDAEASADVPHRGRHRHGSGHAGLSWGTRGGVPVGRCRWPRLSR